MAAKKKKIVKDVEKEIDLDSIITSVGDELELAPTNLIRGGNVKDAVSTGILALDLILGGGWSPGRRCNIFGREQGGKSTLLYLAVKSCIDAGIHTVFFDFEGATDADRVQRMGVKVDWARELESKEPVYFRYYDNMKHGEQMFRLAKRVMDQLPERADGPVQVAFFLDSLPTVPPEEQVEKDDIGTNAMRARLFSEQLPLIKSRVSAKRCIWIDTNQLKTNPRQAYGNPEYEMCGDAVKTISDIRVKAKKTIPPAGRGRPEKKTYIEEEKCWDGFGMDKYTFSEMYVTKNKSFSPFRGCIVRIWFEEAGGPGRGVDPVYDVFEYLKLTGQIELVKRPAREGDKKKISCFKIALAPYNEPRTVKIYKTDKDGEDVINKETGEVETEDAQRDFWTWSDLKELLLNPAIKKMGKQWDIVTVCRKQLSNGEAFEMYFKTINANSGSVSEDEEEDEKKETSDG